MISSQRRKRKRTRRMKKKRIHKMKNMKTITMRRRICS